jgi:hypothetical protein
MFLKRCWIDLFIIRMCYRVDKECLCPSSGDFHKLMMMMSTYLGLKI